jgi:hypothetical protein
MTATEANHGIGGAECLSDRLLCVRDDKRTPSEESNAHNLALRLDKYEDMANSPQTGVGSIVQPRIGAKESPICKFFVFGAIDR